MEYYLWAAVFFLHGMVAYCGLSRVVDNKSDDIGEIVSSSKRKCTATVPRDLIEKPKSLFKLGEESCDEDTALLCWKLVSELPDTTQRTRAKAFLRLADYYHEHERSDKAHYYLKKITRQAGNRETREEVRMRLRSWYGKGLKDKKDSGCVIN